MMDSTMMKQYAAILKEELLPAMGCTEPIAVAYAAAYLTRVLGGRPKEIDAEVSGNILKNVKSVVVPNTGGLCGVKAAIAAGVVAGDPDRKLEVISSVTPQQRAQIKEYMQTCPIALSCMQTPRMLDIRLTGRSENKEAVVQISNNHTNIVYVEYNGKIVLQRPASDDAEDNLTDKSVLNVRDIVSFAKDAPLALFYDAVKRQIDYNSAIAEEGISGKWGAGVGWVMLQSAPDDVATQARAYAAAGSDARMSGCELPVVIVSGSGNQGITACVPVVRFAKYLKADEEKTVRAVALSDLITIHQKTGIGRLSAYCGAVSAGCGAACGVAYLFGGGEEAVAATLKNAIAIASGMICDGAKPSCAAKIATSVQAGLLGYAMYRKQKGFKGGDGIVSDDVEDTIRSVGVLAKDGMQHTDKVILDIMLNN